MISENLAVYGGGRMGLAMLKGWLDGGMDKERVAVFDPFPSEELLALDVKINPDEFDADIVVLAVKPQIMPALLEETPLSDDALYISVAAGVPIAAYEAGIGSAARIIRAMPNTPAAIGAGITALIGNDAVGDADLSMAETLLEATGKVVRLTSEADMDAVTGLSGSGPAYVFYMIEALRAAGEAEGLAPEIAHQLALETVAGAGQLARISELDPSTLRQNVMSPGGTTVAGLEKLMDDKNGLAPLIKDTVKAAANRSRELGK